MKDFFTYLKTFIIVAVIITIIISFITLSMDWLLNPKETLPRLFLFWSSFVGTCVFYLIENNSSVN